jgi:hypothetical protein
MPTFGNQAEHPVTLSVRSCKHGASVCLLAIPHSIVEPEKQLQILDQGAGLRGQASRPHNPHKR